jgi:hypothetical protein
MKRKQIGRISPIKYWVRRAMDEMTAKWVIENFSDREDYQDNQTVQEWLDQARQVLEARRLDY